MYRHGFSLMISHPGAGEFPVQIGTLASLGFDSFFLSSGVTGEYDRIPEWAQTARRENILFEAVHLPGGVLTNLLWDADAGNGDLAVAEYKRIIGWCAAGDVRKCVLHTAYDPAVPITETGLSRFARLEEFAQENGVHLCYENAVSPTHLKAVMSRAGSYHGFCLDTGHQHCYTPDVDWLSLYGDRLLYTHLHDNDGQRDRHYLPFDGTCDWDHIAAGLRACRYEGTLNAELSANREDYKETPFTVFAGMAMERLLRLEKMTER